MRAIWENLWQNATRNWRRSSHWSGTASLPGRGDYHSIQDHLYTEGALCLQEDSAVSADSGRAFSGHSAETDQGPGDQRGRVLLDQSDEVILTRIGQGRLSHVLLCIFQILLDGEDGEAEDDPHESELRVRVPGQHQPAGHHPAHGQVGAMFGGLGARCAAAAGVLSVTRYSLSSVV